jgi:hypothetical protein
VPSAVESTWAGTFQEDGTSPRVGGGRGGGVPRGGRRVGGVGVRLIAGHGEALRGTRRVPLDLPEEGCGGGADPLPLLPFGENPRWVGGRGGGVSHLPATNQKRRPEEGGSDHSHDRLLSPLSGAFWAPKGQPVLKTNR